MGSHCRDGALVLEGFIEHELGKKEERLPVLFMADIVTHHCFRFLNLPDHRQSRLCQQEATAFIDIISMQIRRQVNK